MADSGTLCLKMVSVLRNIEKEYLSCVNYYVDYQLYMRKFSKRKSEK